MARILVWLLLAATLYAQSGQPTRDDLSRMIDEMRAAIRREDWSEASRISIRINAALLMRTRTQATPLLELQHLQTLAGSDPIRRNPYLARLAKAAHAASSRHRGCRQSPWMRRGRSPGGRG